MRNCFQSTLTQRLAKIISFTCRDTALGLHRVAVSVEDEVWSLALRGTAKVGEGSSRSCRANPMPENPAGGSACGVVLHRTLPQGPRPHDAVLPLTHSIPLSAFKILPEPTHSTLGYVGLNIYTVALLIVPICLVSVMKGCLTMSDFQLRGRDWIS